jgi:hypothetical protein
MVEPIQELNPNMLQRSLTTLFKREFVFPPLLYNKITYEGVSFSPNKIFLYYFQTYISEGDTDKHYRNCYLFKHSLNKLTFIGKFFHIIQTNNWNDNVVVLGGSRTQWKAEENSAILEFLDLKTTIKAVDIENNNSLLKETFKMDGEVSPLEIQLSTFLGDLNSCPKRHTLKWDFRQETTENVFTCESCFNFELRYRGGWYCYECVYFICAKCKLIPAPENTCCPKKHLLKWSSSKQSPPEPKYPKNLPDKSKKIYEAQYKNEIKNFQPALCFCCPVCERSDKYESGRWECGLCDWKLCSKCRKSED